MKKLLAMTLALSMTVGLLNLTAFAAGRKDSLTVEAGMTLTLDDADGTSRYGNVVAEPGETIWASQNEGIATVNQAGEVTGVSEGTATITRQSYAYWLSTGSGSTAHNYYYSLTDVHPEKAKCVELTTTWTVTVTPTSSQVPVYPDAPEWDLSKSKAATNLDENFESKVTLSLPAASYTSDLDVVFVLDGSTSTDRSDLSGAAADMLDLLAAYENLTVKVGVVIFGGNTPILSSQDLCELTSTSLAAIQENVQTTKYNDLKDENGQKLRSGSNIHAGVERAREIFAKDPNVSYEDKYIILLTDGGARVWYENDTSYSQAYYITPIENPTLANHSSLKWNYNDDFYYYREFPVPSFTRVWQAAMSGENISQYKMSYEEYWNKTYDPSHVAPIDTVKTSPDYYTTYEVAAYYAATSIALASQEAHVMLVSYPYGSDPTESYYIYSESFKSWLESKGYVTRFDAPIGLDPSAAEQIFSDVKDELIQLVDAGSKVVDVIGSGVDNAGNNYNFDFVNQADKLTLTVGGTSLAVTQINGITYGFGTAQNGVYPFVVTYYANGEDGASPECFVWDINQAVTKDAPVHFTYSVVLTNPQSAAGTYGVYDADGSAHEQGLLTNLEATLYPMDSNHTPGSEEPFNKPTVSYTVESSGNDSDDGDDGDYTPDNPPTVNVPDEDTPTTELPEEQTPTTELPEEQTPTTELPEEQTPTTEEPVTELPEEEVPMAEVPATGDPSLIWLAASALSGSGLGWLALSERRRKEQED